MTSRRALTWGIAIASLYLSIIVGALLFMSRKRNADVPRHHLYYCLHPQIAAAMPCMFRKNDPINV